MKVLITDSYALNSGDIAIVMSTVEGLREKFGDDVSIAIETSHPHFLSQYSEFRDCVLFPRVFDIEKLFQDRFDSGALYPKVSVSASFFLYFLGMYDSVTFLVWASLIRWGKRFLWIIRKTRREQACFMYEVDIVISNGGSFLSTRYHYEFRLYLYTIILLLQKPLYIFAQSIGPFNSFLSRLVIPFFLRRASLITVREPYTKEFVSSFKKLSDIECTADIVFSLRGKNLPRPFGYQQYVSIIIKDPKDMRVQKEYVRAIYDILLHISNQDLGICLMAHTTADDTLCDQLYSWYLQKHPNGHIKKYLFGAHPKELLSLYGDSIYIISSRMHAIIFALAHRIPFVAVGYEEKFIGLIRQLGLEKYFHIVLLDSKKITSEMLLTSVKHVEHNLALYAGLLDEKIEILTTLSRKNISLIHTLIKNDISKKTN